MFKQLFAVLKKEDLVTQSFDQTVEMIKKAEGLYLESVKSFENNMKAGFSIYELDQELNKGEKRIRRQILEHLSVNPQQDIVASLILTSVIISVERIGDYSKNIYELIDLYGSGESITIDELLTDSSSEIGAFFKKVIEVFISGDSDAAEQLMGELEKTKKALNTYIYEEAAAETKRSTRRTIVNVLYSRYLKRVAAHLENVASSIAYPFDKIGFYQGDIRKEADS